MRLPCLAIDVDSLTRGIERRDHLRNAQTITRNAHARVSLCVRATVVALVVWQGCRTCQLATSGIGWIDDQSRGKIGASPFVHLSFKIAFTNDPRSFN